MRHRSNKKIPPPERGGASGVPHRVDAKRGSRLNTDNQVEQSKIRAAFYIDGFNMYHAVENLGKPHLKWTSYWQLAQSIIPQKTEEVVSVTYCTAFYPGDEEKRWRHERMIGAQKCSGVNVVLGHFIKEPRDCRGCKAVWQHPTEKEGDINVAIHLLRDAFMNRFDHAYLVTADSDQAATVRMFRSEFPDKKITAVVPPQKKRSEHIHRYANGGSLMLNESHLEKSVMQPVVFKEGVGSFRRPKQYAPPDGWVHPNSRPKK
jgi:uncharacterized LabA/DUF88 family protein